VKDFVKKISQKISKLTPEQVESLFDVLVQENEELDAIIESVSIGLLSVNKEWILMQSNKAAERLISMKTPYAEQPVWELVGDKDIGDFFKDVSRMQKINVSEEFTIQTPSGTVRFLSINITPLVQRKKMTGYVIKIDDITEKRNQETLLRRMESLASLTNLAASVAHEIKNPLGAISIHIQLVQKAIAKARSSDGQLPDEKFVEKYLGVVNEEIDRLNQIIVDFLFAVRPISAHLEPIEPNSFLSDLSDFFRTELADKNINLELDLLDKSPHIMMDTKLFKQVLINLVQNAIAAVETVQEQNKIGYQGRLLISTKLKNDKFILALADNGVGMDKETSSRIFEPYYTTKANGTGLGLTMVYKIIKELSGDIDATSFPGEGTVFTITLPVIQRERRLIEYQKQ
jgi:PAS domain S-box-containing protein